MNNKNTISHIPSRILYTMIGVCDLERSDKFFQEVLGMHELRREAFTEGRFILVFLGYGNEASNTLIELAYNWDESRYDIGTGYGNMVLEVVNINAACTCFEEIG